MHFLAQFFIGEPDEVSKPGRNKFVGVGDAKFQLGAGGRIRIGKGNVAESSTFAELPRRFLEVLFVSDSANRQSAGERDFLLRETFAAGHLDRDQLVSGGWHGVSGGAGRWLGLRGGAQREWPEEKGTEKATRAECWNE